MKTKNQLLEAKRKYNLKRSAKDYDEYIPE